MGNLPKRVVEAYKELCEKQERTLSNPSEVAVQEEAEAYAKWLHIASLEEGYLKQKAKLHWLDVGDQNNKTFYNAIKTRHAQNAPNGVTVKTQLEIKNEAERFFSEF